jgi:hypothetical protein
VTTSAKDAHIKAISRSTLLRKVSRATKATVRIIDNNTTGIDCISAIALS